MKYHDFHLQGYEISDRGETITLHLIYDYPNCEKEESTIKFSGVVLSSFTHTTSAIITYIHELTVEQLIAEYGDQIKELDRLYGVRYWKNDLVNFKEVLEANGCGAWVIESAIGFRGLVVANGISGA